MRKRMYVALFLGVLVLLFAGLASAADIRERIDNQQKRINQGINSGELTRGEADIVQDNLNYIKDEFARTKADGRLGTAERDRLNDLLNRNSRMIENKKNNPATGFRNGGRYDDDWRDRKWDWDRKQTIQERIDNQQRRIDHGIRIGELTRNEADIVQDNLNYIKREFARARNNDGAIGPRERERLNDLIDRNSKIIFNKEHNPARRLY